jgi:hypothetical protein
MERALARWLRWGTRAALAVCLIGLAWMTFGGAGIPVGGLADLEPCPFPCRFVPGGWLVLVGAMLLISVSAGRLIVLSVLWARRGERSMAVVAVAAAVLVAAALAFRI